MKNIIKFLVLTASVALLSVLLVFCVSADAHTDNYKTVYAMLQNCIEKGGSSVDISLFDDITDSDIQQILTDIVMSDSSLFHFNGAGNISGRKDADTGVMTISSVSPTYLYPADELAAKISEFDAEVAQIAAGIRAYGNISDYEKVLALNEYFAAYFSYDYDAADSTPYTLLKTGSGSAGAYAKLADCVFGKLGIVSYIVTSEKGHSWNIVTINGKNYNVDLAANHRTNQQGYSNHNYLLLSDSAIADTNHAGSNAPVSCTDKTFDGYFWRGINTRFAYLDGKWYYSVYSAAKAEAELFCRVFGEAQSSTVAAAQIGVWSTFGSISSAYENSFCSVATYGGLIYFNTAKKVLSYNPATSAVSEVLSADCRDGYVYSLVIDRNGLLSYTISKSYTSGFTVKTHQLAKPNYTVTFMNGGTVVLKTTLESGTAIIAPSVTVASGYEWTGFAAGMKAYGNYTFNVREFAECTYIFKNRDGSVLLEKTVEAGSIILPPAKPSSESDATNSYEFVSWTGYTAAMTAQGNITFDAVYKPVPLFVTIRFFDEDGVTPLSYTDENGITQILIKKVEHGAVINQMFEISDWRDYQYSYKHIGWVGFTAGTIADHDLSYTVIWQKTVNKYTYVFYDRDGVTKLKELQADYGTVITPPSNPADYSDDGYNYTFGGWNYNDGDGNRKQFVAGMKVTGKDKLNFAPFFRVEAKIFKVTFKLHHGTVIDENEMAYNATITDLGSLSEYSDVQYIYTFSKWLGYENGMKVTKDTVITAVFAKKLRQYKYVFLANDQETVLFEGTADYGTYIKAPASPTRAKEGGINYSFKNWQYLDENNVQKVFEENKVLINPEYIYRFVAMYDFTLDKYDVRLVREDGTVLENTKYEYGSELTLLTGSQLDYSDSLYNYKFLGWEGYTEKMMIASDLTITAKYEKTPIVYTCIFYAADGKTVLEEQKINSGSVITPPTPPAREADKSYEYTFDGWNGYTENMTATQDMNFQAHYTSKQRVCTVTLKKPDGTVVYTQELPSGTVLNSLMTLDNYSDGTYFYRFSGWENFTEGTAVYSDLEIVAKFDAANLPQKKDESACSGMSPFASLLVMISCIGLCIIIPKKH